MKKIIISMGLFLAILAIEISAQIELTNSKWYKVASEKLKQSEYNITYQADESKYTSPNRRQNLRFFYYRNGFKVEPLTPNSEGGIWSVSFLLNKTTDGNTAVAFKGNKLNVNKNSATVEDDFLKINYLNNQKGMRQDFIIKKSLSSKANQEPIRLIIESNTGLNLSVFDDGLSLTNANEAKVFYYDDLKVWDASNKILEAEMQKIDENHFAIVINDENAVYPITVDPLSYVPDWSAHGQVEGEFFGSSASNAGDVNGDGYDDIIVGASGYSNGGGKAYVYYGGADGPSATADWTVTSSQDNGRFGSSVSGAGDVNGDGYDDVLIGADAKDNGQTSEGEAYLYLGSASGLSSAANWFDDGDQDYAYFGNEVVGTGDLNGDGYDDIAIGAYGYDIDDSVYYDVGRVYVYYGSHSGLDPNPNWIATGDIPEGDFGYHLSAAGDVNGDGYDDLLIGQDEFKDSNGDYVGKAYLYYGTENGLRSDSLWTMVSDQSSSSFGTVANFGDINNDGYDDIGIAAPYYDESALNTGKLFVYFGSSNGPSSTADWTAVSPNYDDYLDRPSFIGDINGDGYDDISATSIVFGNCEGDEGKVFVWYGGANGPLQSSGNYDNADWSYEGNQTSARAGHIFGAGDVNNDGIDDFMVAAPVYDAISFNEGKVDLFLGPTKTDKPVGNGTEQDPYQISNLRELYWVTENDSVWDKNFIQTADIEASSSINWIDSDCNDPEGFLLIGTSSNYFTGTYDGQNHMIDSVYIYRPGENVVGLFGESYTATIKNLKLTNVDVTGQATVGGLVGYAFSSTITNSSTSGTVDGDVYMQGGLIGNSNFSTVENSNSSATVNGVDMVGGLIGNSANTDITLCRAIGTVTGTGSKVGGFAGKNVNSHIYKSSSYGNVSGASYLGGFVGFNDATSTIQNSFSMGDVERADDETSTNNAGFCGQNDNSTIRYSYSKGSVNYVNSTNPADKGFVGTDNSGTYSDNYWDTETSNQTASAASTASGKTTSQMTTQSTFTGWDFTTPIWEINSAINDGYPFISGLEFTNEVIQLAGIGTSFVILDAANIGFESESGSVGVDFEMMNAFPPNFPEGQPFIGNYWDITSVSGGNVKLRLYYLPDEISDFDGTPKIFHYDGSDWVELATSAEMTEGDWRYVETTNYFNSFSPVTVGDAANPLPVELVSFTGTVTEDAVLLNWTTATEVNNYGFDVELRIANGEWETRGFVQGNGTTNSPKEYSFVDNELPDTNKVTYRLKQIDNDGTVSYSKTITVNISEITGVGDDAEYKFSLKQNYPNPFNPTTTIKYSVSEQSKVELKIFDILGSEVTTLVNETKIPGNYEVEFNGESLTSGVYFYRLSSNDKVLIKKLMLIK